VIRDTIAKLNMVALGRVVLARREHRDDRNAPKEASRPEDRGFNSPDEKGGGNRASGTRRFFLLRGK
jgi:hypothetical protein